MAESNVMNIPCKECISFAICRNKIEVRCTILNDIAWEVQKIAESGDHTKIINRWWDKVHERLLQVESIRDDKGNQ